MRQVILDNLNTQIDDSIKKLLQKLDENSSAAININIANVLQSLQRIFLLQEPICKELEILEKSPQKQLSPETMQTLEGLALIIWIAELMATRMNCPIGSDIDKWLYELQSFNHHN